MGKWDLELTRVKVDRKGDGKGLNWFGRGEVNSSQKSNKRQLIVSLGDEFLAREGKVGSFFVKRDDAADAQ